MWWNDLRVSSPLYLLPMTRRLPKHKCKPKDLDGNNPLYARVHVRLNSMIIDRSVTGRNPAPVEIKWNLEQAWRFFILNGARILPSTVAHLQTAQFFKLQAEWPATPKRNPEVCGFSLRTCARSDSWPDVGHSRVPDVPMKASGSWRRTSDQRGQLPVFKRIAGKLGNM